jgi:cytoskeletal protein CcmA (bactofilin family)
MSHRETESNSSDKKSFLSDSGKSADFAQNLLHETNQSFLDWLKNLNSSQSDERAESAEPAGAEMTPSKPREIGFEGTLKVDGYMAGFVNSEHGSLVVTEGGEIDGDISVSETVIHGTVRGDIRATKKVDMGGSARVIGDIETLELSIQPGAKFEGRCAFPAESNQTSDSRPAEVEAPDGDGEAEGSLAAAG